MLVTFLNPYSYLIGRKYIELFWDFDLIYIDGIILVKILKILNIVDTQRVSFDMTSLAPIVFNSSIKKEWKVYFLGTKPYIIEKAIRNIKEKYPKLNIIGYRNGYFTTKKEWEDLIRHLSLVKPDLLVCGMGTPLQEKFLVELRREGWRGIGYTCGGFLHQTAQKLEYYPFIIDKLHLRWVYRMIKEPKLIKRYLILYPIAILVIFWDFFQYKFFKKENLISLIKRKAGYDMLFSLKT